MRTVEQVAPIVFKMLDRDIEPKVIEVAILNASVLTQAGIEYALNNTARLNGGMKQPRYAPAPQPGPPLTADQKRRNVAHVRELREQLRKNGPA